MLQTKTIRKNEAVAVAFAPTEIMVRAAGRENYGKEEFLCQIVNGNTLLIDNTVAEKFEIGIKVKEPSFTEDELSVIRECLAGAPIITTSDFQKRVIDKLSQ